jgi:hypothetical protein
MIKKKRHKLRVHKLLFLKLSTTCLNKNINNILYVYQLIAGVSTQITTWIADSSLG